jgi:hypothetical protein
MHMITEPTQIREYNIRVLIRALGAYDKHKMQFNRNLSPARMLKMASTVTGKAYKRGAYRTAIADLEAHIAE